MYIKILKRKPKTCVKHIVAVYNGLMKTVFCSLIRIIWHVKAKMKWGVCNYIHVIELLNKVYVLLCASLYEQTFTKYVWEYITDFFW